MTQKSNSLDFEKESEALIQIKNEILAKLPLQKWSFGGGTALSLFHFQHRRSFDIDIFINDPQYFGYLSPKFYLEESTFFEDTYIETANQITLTTKSGVKIDFLLAPPLTRTPFDIVQFAGFEFQVESVEEIIGKKIFYRREQNKTRDIFDIAYALSLDKDLLTNLVSQEAITLDMLQDFEQFVHQLDTEKFAKEISLIYPVKAASHLKQNAKEIILDTIAETLENLRSNLEGNYQKPKTKPRL